jgi:hypothetical protein
MELGSRLPEDVLNLIFEMNPEHREKFRSVIPDIELKGTLMILDTIHKIWENETDHSEFGISYNQTLRNNISDPDYFIARLKRCSCCSRHKLKKPISLADRGDYDPRVDPYEKLEQPGGFVALSLKKCECICRNTSRHIYHSFRGIHLTHLHNNFHEFDEFDDFDDFNDYDDF